MTRYILFLLLSFFPLLLSATHNRAGEITYEQIGVNTIRMKITTYTKTSGQSIQADRPELDVDWGDGTRETVVRANFVQIYPDIRRNEYIAVHTYPGANIPNRPYIVSMQDPNRNENILNINGGNSVNVEFYLQTEVYLFASAASGSNSSPILLEAPVDFGVVGQIFQHTPNGYDPDGDSIAYELITPFSDRGAPVPGYVPVSVIRPGANNIYTFDVNTGLFTWNSPQQAGEYNIAILVKSYRNGQYLGGIVRDIQIEIRNAQNTPPLIEAPTEICVQAGELINFEVIASDLDIPSQVVTLTATGGPFQQAVPATFTGGQGNPVTGIFNWQTDCSHIQAQPYQVVFKARDTYFINGGNTDASLATFHILQIRVIAPAPQNVQAEVTGGRVLISWDAPYVCDTTAGFFGFTVWRKDVCDPFEPDSCQTGLGNRGYLRINPQLVRTPNGNRYEFVDTDVVQGALYSYRILGEFATPIYNNGVIVNYQSPASSVPSSELCVRMARDLPLMTNVDINTTLTANAEIFVQWSKPDAVELDTLQNPPPYRYELYRSADMNGGNFGFAPIYTSPTYATFAAANDTNFTDINAVINTQDLPYSYRVAFYANGGDTIGYTSIASSVRLSVASTDGRNDLTWAFNVPWRNNRYVVYLETPTNSGTYTVLDTVEERSYAHTGLTNGEEYCYYIQSIGTYGIPSVLDPLYNKSQRACGTPLDTLPPCPPAFVANVLDCDELSPSANAADLFNQIRWASANDSCAADAAAYRVYFSPYCSGTYTMVAEITNLNDTFLLHQPAPNNLAGCYYVAVVDSLDVNGGGNESARSEVVRTDNCPIYALPNAFTPNGDGQNELFRPFLPFRYVDSVDFRVVNRWGQTVFVTTDPNIGWDGTDQKTGKPLAEETYFYTCVVFENRLEGPQQRTLTGYIELIRNAQ